MSSVQISEVRNRLKYKIGNIAFSTDSFSCENTCKQINILTRYRRFRHSSKTTSMRNNV